MKPKPQCKMGWRLGGFWVGVWMACCLAIPAWAVEWTAPPGMNVPAQEAALKKRVTNAARDLVGADLLEVIVHVGYVRVESKVNARSADALKLPGFNRFLRQDGGDKAEELVPEFARTRQVIVMVSDKAEVGVEELQSQLKGQAAMDEKGGDRLRVVMVKLPEPPPAQGGQPPGGHAPEKGPLGQPPGGPGGPRKSLAMMETQASMHLVRAREHYFKGEYTPAMDQILQALTIDPDNAQGYSMLGSLYYALKWKGLAVKYWQRALELDPANRELDELLTQVRLGETPAQGPTK